MRRHGRDNFYVVGEGIYGEDRRRRPVCNRPSTIAELRKFRFSRMGPKGRAPSAAVREALALAMTAGTDQPDASEPQVPAGHTYLGQFIDHDMTMDATRDVAFGQEITLEQLVQGRSPALDLDSLYGLGPLHPESSKLYSDSVRLKVGRTAAVPEIGPGTPAGAGTTNVDREGFDLPRVGTGSSKFDRRKALIADHRNDENLAVGQTHLAFIRFHNRVVETLASEGTPGSLLFARARAEVVKHYQWMLVTDYLPSLVDPAIIADVFQNGRKAFEVPAPAGWEDGEAGDGRNPAYSSYMVIQPGDTPTMPLEFSVAAFRLGHSMVREAYQWNRVFRGGGVTPASLALLFRFSSTSGNLSPDGDVDDPDGGTFERLPTNWIIDWRRLFNFSPLGQADLVAPDGELNLAKRIDSLLVDPLKQLPFGSFGPRVQNPPARERNLAFRNLTRALMLQLATGQQMAAYLAARGVAITPLTAAQILDGDGGAALNGLSQAQRDDVAEETPLWFYILREAELNGGRLTGVGGRIVAEVFHRAIEGSRHSIVRDPSWRPRFARAGESATFKMIDLLFFAFEGKAELLNPLGD